MKKKSRLRETNEIVSADTVNFTDHLRKDVEVSFGLAANMNALDGRGVDIRLILIDVRR